jgi:pimeloyl-ACP methyl ester carboxylesterase
MAYVDVGGAANNAPVVVFLHGNPTSSFLWRNIIPVVRDSGARCLAPDLVGMGNSEKFGVEEKGYFKEHYGYLSSWFEAMVSQSVLPSMFNSI